MQTEIEAKFLNVDHDIIRQKLLQLGAKRQVAMRTLYRNSYDFPDRRLATRNGWVQLRNEGDTVTMSYKEVQGNPATAGAKDIKLAIASFEQGDIFMRALGLEQTVHIAIMRESWQLGHIGVELDQLPWAKPYIEVKAHTADELRLLAGRLGLDWSRAVQGGTEAVYMAEYDVTQDQVDSWTEIAFTPVPLWLETKRKAVM